MNFQVRPSPCTSLVHRWSYGTIWPWPWRSHPWPWLWLVKKVLDLDRSCLDLGLVTPEVPPSLTNVHIIIRHNIQGYTWTPSSLPFSATVSIIFFITSACLSQTGADYCDQSKRSRSDLLDDYWFCLQYFRHWAMWAKTIRLAYIFCCSWHSFKFVK